MILRDGVYVLNMGLRTCKQHPYEFDGGYIGRKDGSTPTEEVGKYYGMVF